MKNNEQLLAGGSSAGAADSVQLRGCSHYEYHSSRPSDSQCTTPTPLYKIYTHVQCMQILTIYILVSNTL